MSLLLWTGIACAVVLAAVFAWSLWRGPRVRPSKSDDSTGAVRDG